MYEYANINKCYLLLIRDLLVLFKIYLRFKHNMSSKLPNVV